MKIKSTALSVKAGPDDGLEDGEFIAYPSTFTRKPDSYGDVVAKGAFLDTIKEWKESGNTMPGLYGHRLDDPDYFVASATDMGEDDHGWWVKGKFDLDSPKGMQVYRLVKGRRISQLSFAFDVLDEGIVELEDGTKANELRKLKAYEFSFVPVGANQDTSVAAVKAIADAAAGAVKEGLDVSGLDLDAIRSAHATLGEILAVADEDDSKASGTPAAKGEEPELAKPEEPKAEPSVEAKSQNIISYWIEESGKEFL